jgi:DNA-binding Xre family transcriptional regulator
MVKQIFEEMRLHFPTLANRVVSITGCGLDGICVKMDDGTVVFYDAMDKSIRRLPENGNDMSELECRQEFALRLRRIMLQKNISQKELSETCKITPPQLSGYLTGKHTPSFYIVDKIAKALGCSVDELRYID